MYTDVQATGGSILHASSLLLTSRDKKVLDISSIVLTELMLLVLLSDRYVTAFVGRLLSRRIF